MARRFLPTGIMSCDWSCDRSLDRRQKKNIHVKGFLLRPGDETRHDETNERNEMEVSREAESPCRHLCRHAIQSVCVCHMNCLYTVSLLLHIKISNICKPEEGWYGQSKYCYKKTIHVVMNQLCSSLWTSRFWLSLQGPVPNFGEEGGGCTRETLIQFLRHSFRNVLRSILSVY